MIISFQDTSNSEEEGFLMQILSHRKKSLKKRKRKLELQKKWNERRKRKAPPQSIASYKEKDKEDSRAETKISRTKSSRQIPAKKNQIEKIASTLEQQEKISRILPEETTLVNPQVRLKQTKLNFEIKQATNADNLDESPLFHSALRSRTKPLKSTKLVTSTPIRRLNMTSSSSLEIDITHIEPFKQIANKLNDTSDKLNSRKSDRLNDSRNTNN